MPNLDPDPIQLDRLLNVLDVAREAPSLRALTDLTTRYVTHVPFENVSKLYYFHERGWRHQPDITTFVDGVERYGFGGTCYTNNYYLHLLLVHLGYDVMLCGADMNQPDVHIVNIVRVDGREYLVDSGYAAPFLEPIPRDLDHDYEIELGTERHILHPQDGEGRSRLDHFRKGTLIHGYTAKPTVREITYFEGAVTDSYRDEGTFMHSVSIIRFFSPLRSLTLRNLAIYNSVGTEYTLTRLANRSELPVVAERLFGMPREIVASVLDHIGELRGEHS